MSLHLATERDREEWNQFVALTPGGSFLQSWEWGEVQRAFGLEMRRLVARENGRVVGVAMVVTRNLPSGQRWLYLPRGPVGENSKLLEHIIELGREQRALFVRIEPSEVPAESWRKALRDVQPRHTLIVDLKQSEEDLLNAMHQKTRYNIRLAEKHGVRVRFSNTLQDVELFLRLSREVSGRGSFRFHPPGYYRSLLRVLGTVHKDGATAELGLAEHNGTVLAAHILISFGGTVTYAHGASSSHQRGLMAPHLLQWQSLQRAQERGFSHYDFFGVAPASARTLAGASLHPWTGITRFKEGFGGRRVSYVGAYDFVLNKPGYWLYSLAHKLK